MANLADLLDQMENGPTPIDGAVVSIGGKDFSLTVASDASLVTASYGSTNGETLDLLGFVGDLPVNLDTTGLSLNVALSQVLLVVKLDSGSAKALLAFDLGISFDFVADLPVIGTALSFNDDALAGSFQLLAATNNFSEGDITAIGLDSLPSEVSGGLNLEVALDIAGTTTEFSLSIVSIGGGATVDPTQWCSVQRSFGPVMFEKIGLSYEAGELIFSLDASMESSGFTIALSGLSLSTPITAFSPSISLEAMDVAYDSAGLTVSGTLLYDDVSGEFAGQVLFSYGEFNLTALGAYKTIDGQPSLFIYLVLDYPLGGPPIFLSQDLPWALAITAL